MNNHILLTFVYLLDIETTTRPLTHEEIKLRNECVAVL